MSVQKGKHRPFFTLDGANFRTPISNGAKASASIFTANNGLSSLFGCLCSSGITAVEAINASCCVNQFLLARKERVAFRTNFNVQVLAHRRTGLE